MSDPGLVTLMRELARLSHPRSSTPREDAVLIAWNKITAYARANELGNEWCNRVMKMMFVTEQARAKRAA